MALKHFCCLPVLVDQVYNHIAGDSNVFRGLAQSSKFWENGSTITWWAEDHPDVRFVADGFELLDDIVGLTFEQVFVRGDADIRIGFDYSLGSWSYIGTDAQFIGVNANTMNFGWPLQNSFDTVLHEQIHALGGLHEHQSPDRSLVFDRERVISDLAAQGWSEADVESNIFAVAFADVSSGYDIESIMHYSLPSSWLNAPEPYSTNGIPVNQSMSQADVVWLSEQYPVSDSGEELSGMVALESSAVSGSGSFQVSETGFVGVGILGSSNSLISVRQGDAVIAAGETFGGGVGSFNLVEFESLDIVEVNYSTNENSVFVVWKAVPGQFN